MSHPYKNLPNYQFWKKNTAFVDPNNFDPVITSPFRINKEDPIVTMGSCFAQHVANALNTSGFNHYISEKAHPIFDSNLSKEFNYGVFSARYGNIYTTRQLKQLLYRAYGNFIPKNDFWKSSDDKFIIDPFRPQIQPEGFISLKELKEDRLFHFSAIRSSIEKMSYFIFTLGLTECWLSTLDGAVYPIAPGISGGKYKKDEVQFYNFNLSEVMDDLIESLNFIRSKNPKVKIILTVSPVPLNATYEKRHIVVSNTLSKSILRIAANEVSNLIEDCYYFPSYEIIKNPFKKGQYFEKDCRSVTKTGINHVMKLFFKHYCELGKKNFSSINNQDNESISHVADMEKYIDILCDEENITNE
jgi:hypothetical protein